jgi:beta-phosphoglucomutase-like phosphatase (HAD superfamily)
MPMARVSAITFDFNGTVSDDEPILCAIFQGLFRERGRPLSEQEYYDELAGLSDEAIVTTWLGHDYPDVAGAVAERVQRYRGLVADGSTIDEATREAVRYAAARVPTAIVSGAALAEILPVARAAGLDSVFEAIVSAEAVTRGKPHPEGYLRALELLGAPPEEAVAFEDTESGIASATGAGMRCIAVRGTLAPARLAKADELVDAIDVDVVRRLFEP